jgi:hypothetical protein
MPKPSRKIASKKQNKPRKYEKPLSLYGTSFLGAIDTLLATKPSHSKKAPKRR